MRFMIMHKTTAHWESGATPTPELIAQVGAMIGQLAQKGVLLAGEGLRASSQGVRLNFEGGRRTVTPGPFPRGQELPAGFALLRTASLDEAIAWSTRLAAVLGDVEIDLRPVTEPWDLGFAPKPEGLATRRWMALHKATAASEAGEAPTPKQKAALARLVAESTREGVLLVLEGLAPSAKGRRFKAEGGRRTVVDGPFAESKELMAGYVMVKADSLDEASAYASRYIEVVGTEEVDVRLVAEP